MKAHRPLLIKFMTLVVGLALCGVPECAQAWPQEGAASPQNGPTAERHHSRSVARSAAAGSEPEQPNRLRLARTRIPDSSGTASCYSCAAAQARAADAAALGRGHG